MSTPNVYPLNDLIFRVKLKEVVNGAVTSTPLTTGTVTAFLATSTGNTATAADATLSVSGTHVSNGLWQIVFDAATLTTSLLNTLFASTAPVLIIVQSGGFRTATQLAYSAVRTIVAD